MNMHIQNSQKKRKVANYLFEGLPAVKEEPVTLQDGIKILL